jgi:DUF218 domain
MTGTLFSRAGCWTSARLIGWITLLVVVVATGLSWAYRTSILRGVARLWVVSDDLDRADAIVVLGGGLGVRLYVAADLYKHDISSQVLVANEYLGPGWREVLYLLPSDAELKRKVLIEQGVPSTAVTEFGNEVSTAYEEARALLEWAKRSGARSVVIPIDIFSTRRVRWIIDHELAPAGIHVIVRAVTPQEYGIDDWWQHKEGLMSFQNEVIKFIYYRVKY